MKVLASVIRFMCGSQTSPKFEDLMEAASHLRIDPPEGSEAIELTTDEDTAVLPDDAPTILVVDDELVVRGIAVKMLHRNGFRALEAADGAEAVRVFKNRRTEISAVLLDLVMPVMSGDEALRAMRRIDSAVPVIVSSGYSAKMVRARCGTDHPDGFLQKPYQDRELLEVLRKAF